MAWFGNKTPATGLQHPKHLGDGAIVIGQDRKNTRGDQNIEGRISTRQC
jgi:hypothetical protein